MQSEDVSPTAPNPGTSTGKLGPFVRALRTKQWTKNALVFAAIVFSGEFTDPTQWIVAATGFAAFCFMSSAGYIINDIRDREADAKHPRKRLRPIANGDLTVSAAAAEAVLVAILGLACAALVSSVFVAVVVAYFLTTMSYSLYFKQFVIIDVMMIASGFIWRAVAGAIAIDVRISEWLLICTAFLALFLGFNKRRAELRLLKEDAGITTSGAIISYALYTVSGPGKPWLLVTMPYVLYGIFRYIYLVDQHGAGGAPDETLLRDRPILINCLLYVFTAAAVLLLAGDVVS
jgi:4-hydroxybenzoate polyprenyltransferase